MVYFLIVFVFFQLLSSPFVASAEQCQFYPGEVKFTFETSEDEQLYYGKYGGGGKTFRKGNINVHYQQQQQQQNFYRSPEITLTTEKPPTRPEPLPIWKLRLPQNAKSVQFYHLSENGEALNNQSLTTDDFENSTTESNYVREVDVTTKGIVPSGWYLIRMNISIVRSNLLTACEHNTLIKACTKRYSCQKLLGVIMNKKWQTATAATVHYQVNAFPLKSASVSSELIYEPEYRRCLAEEKESEQIMGWLFLDSVTVIEHKNLRKDRAYSLTTDLRITITAEGSDSEILLRDFFGDTVKTVPRCSLVDEYRRTEAEN